MQCESKWGLLSKIMTKMKTMNLDVIDHRSWHPSKWIEGLSSYTFVFLYLSLLLKTKTNHLKYFSGGVDATVVNEVYAKYVVSQENFELTSEIQKPLFELLDQPVSIIS